MNTWQPPQGWYAVKNLYAHIYIQCSEVTAPISERWCQGEWSHTPFFCATVQDTVDLFDSWSIQGYTISPHLNERLCEQIRIAQAVGHQDKDKALKQSMSHL